jgi:hypothetical protein
MAELGVAFLRVGKAEARIDGVAPHAIERIVGSDLPLDDIARAIDPYRVFATTCLGCEHPVIISHVFDLCVIEEGSQIYVPSVVDTRYQLSPIKNYDAKMHADSLWIGGRTG